ncbi:MFS transporter [Rubrobacter marinus]|uniref:MFS transporter n=1 Tax=Rubrobacter marinus TaxID=2653852 RepID=A0A6G8PTS6_9ACTN|nr:MFS transporter [Rubrobacter marinus]QIN77366.1 MFS transporter [Rubrobacter marinus]
MVIFLAAALGPFAGGLFADLVGIRASFGVTAALLAGSGLMVLFGVGEAKPVREASDEEDGDEPLHLKRRLAPVLAALFVTHLAITGVVPAVPGFLASLVGETARVAGLAGQIIGVAALAAALGSLVGGRLAARFGARRVVIVALVLAGLAFLPQAGVGSVAELWVLRILSSFFLGIVIPVVNLAVRSSVPSARQGAAFGLSASVTSAALGIGPLGGGLLAARFGFEAPFLVPGLLLLGAGAALAALAVAQRKPRYGKIFRLILAHLVSR